MSYKGHLEDLAIKAAEHYYDNVLKKGKYPGEFNMLPADRTQAIAALAFNPQYADKLGQLVSEGDYNDDYAKRLDELDAKVLSDYMFEFGEDPFTAKRKGDLEKIIDNGKNERTWYDMGKKEIESQMYKFGYDPAKRGDRAAFLDEVANYQTLRDRANIVQEALTNPSSIERGLGQYLPGENILAKAGYAMNPTATQEAVKQSLTGNFDDSNMNQAVATDLLAQGAMAVAPSFRAVAASPVVAGGTDLVVEALRQGSAANLGHDVDYMAPLLAGSASATVPTLGLAVGGYLGKAADSEAKAISRGFQRGLRGADDPVEAEKNVLKQTIINARKHQNQMLDDAKKNFDSNPVGMTYSEGDFAKADQIAKARQMLSTLGYESYTSPNFGNPGTRSFSIEDVIGGVPDKTPGVLVYNSPYPEKAVLSDVIAAYNEPSSYYGLSKAGLTIPEQTTIDLNAAARQQMKQVFPEKFAKEYGEGVSKSKYNLGRGAGRFVGGTVGRIEPAFNGKPSESSIEQKIMNFKNSEWYNNLPERKKNAIEKVLKGFK